MADTPIKLERRKQEDELKQVMQQEQHFERVKEQWKTSSNTPGKRKDRSKHEDDDGGSEKWRKSGKRRKDQKTKTQYGEEEEDEYRDEPEAENHYANMRRGTDGDDSEKAPDHLLAAAGLEDSDAEDDKGHPQSAIERKRRAWSESEDEEPMQRPVQPSPGANDQ